MTLYQDGTFLIGSWNPCPAIDFSKGQTGPFDTFLPVFIRRYKHMCQRLRLENRLSLQWLRGDMQASMAYTGGTEHDVIWHVEVIA